MNNELKQNYENYSGNSCFGIGTYPKYGTIFGGGVGGKVTLAGTMF